MIPPQFSEIWQLILAGVGVILYGETIKGRVNSAHARIDAMEKLRTEDKAETAQSRADLKAVLDEMRAESREMRNDIKALLRHEATK